MPKPIKIRVSYDADSNFLLRLKQAVEKDVQRCSKWRKEVIEAINTVVLMLLQAPAKEEKKLGE